MKDTGRDNMHERQKRRTRSAPRNTTRVGFFQELSNDAIDFVSSPPDHFSVYFDNSNAAAIDVYLKQSLAMIVEKKHRRE